jgi:WD40 repeat protein
MNGGNFVRTLRTLFVLITVIATSAAMAQDVKNGETTRPLPVWGLSFSPDGTLLAASTGDRQASGEIIVWNTRDWSEVLRLPEESAPTCVAFSPDGAQLLGGTQRGDVLIVDVHEGRVGQRWDTGQQAVNGATWIPGGEQVLTAGSDGTIKAWDTATGKLRRTLDTWAADEAAGPRGGLGGGGEAQRAQRLIWDVAVSPDGRYVVSGGWGDTTRVWSLSSGELLQSHAATDQSVQGVAFLPDSKHFVSSSQRDGTVYVRETEEGLERAALRNYSGRDVAVHPGGEMLAATSAEGVRVFRLNLALPTDAEVERYQQIIARLEHDDVRVRDAASAEILAIGLPTEPLLFDALSAPGAETRLRCRRLWNQVRAPEPLATLGGQSGELRQVVFSPDGRFLAAGTQDGEVRVWRVPAFELLREWRVRGE